MCLLLKDHQVQSWRIQRSYESPRTLLKLPDAQQRGRKEQGSIESQNTIQSPQSRWSDSSPITSDDDWTG